MSNAHLTRRQACGLLPIVLLSARRLAAQAPEPEFASLDHVEFYVSNIERSRDFFVRAFGTTLRMRGAKRYLKLGSAYMAFELPRGNGTAATVDHYSVSIKKLEMQKLHSFLQEREVAFQDYPSGRDTGVNDPDGTRTQLSPEDGWGLLNPENFVPETTSIPDRPIFQPTGLDHILLNVTDLDRSVAFYRKFLGKPAPGNNDRVWFQVGPSRVGLLRTPAGQRPGVNHFCVSAAAFDYEMSLEKLQQIGAKIESPELAGAPEFRDPDGMLIQVMSR